MHTGVNKLKETDENIEHLEEEADIDVKVSSDIPILVAEDTVSQVPTDTRITFLISRIFSAFYFVTFCNNFWTNILNIFTYTVTRLLI